MVPRGPIQKGISYIGVFSGIFCVNIGGLQLNWGCFPESSSTITPCNCAVDTPRDRRGIVPSHWPEVWLKLQPPTRCLMSAIRANICTACGA